MAEGKSHVAAKEDMQQKLRGFVRCVVRVCCVICGQAGAGVVEAGGGKERWNFDCVCY
jgi:hypothetical protein